MFIYCLDCLLRSVVYPAKLGYKLGYEMGARNFYIACLVQAETRQGKQNFFKFQNEAGEKYKNGAFTFPAKHIESFGFKRQNAATLFRQLEEAGFIDILEKNGHRHKENVYAFSTRWKK